MIADQEQEQKARVEFLQMAGQFLQQAVPLAQQVPEIGVLAGRCCCSACAASRSAVR